MIFSSNKSGGYGGEDLWFSEKKEDNRWSKPVNMGPNINSSYDEISPFYIRMVLLFFTVLIMKKVLVAMIFLLVKKI